MANTFDLVTEALASIAPPVPQRFQSGAWGALPAEKTLTRAIAERVAQDAATIWVAHDKHWAPPSKPTIHASWKLSFFHDIAEVDVAWSKLPSSEPTHLLEVKARSSGGVSQDHYIFLSDVVALAGQYIHRTPPQGSEFSAVYIAPSAEFERKDWLPALTSLTGALEIELEPSAATKSLPGGHAIYWSNQSTGKYKLDHRGGICKLLTGTTGARLSGAFCRPGKLSVCCDVSHGFMANGLWCIVHTIRDAKLSGATLAEWWP